MADVGFRDFGSFMPGRRVRDKSNEPSAPPLTPETTRVEPTPPDTPPPAKTQHQVFAGDRADGPDRLGIDEALAHLAQLALHRGTSGPLSIALIGGAGSGKSFALQRLMTRIADLSAAAKADGPFLSRVQLVTLDAASLDGEPGLALAASLHAGLRKAYPELAHEIGATARDPHAVLRTAEDKLDEARRRLDTERRGLDEAGMRRARLTETVLYEAGSEIDAYARANRGSIGSRLAGFGIGGDAIRNYKDLVQSTAGSGSPIGLALRSLWAFKGQLKLILIALVLIAAGIGLGIAIDDQDAWLGSLRSGGPKAGAATADWLESHMGLLAAAKTGAYALAALALVANVLRALAFLRPILKGRRLLEGDLDSRRRELDGLCAHQTKRVDTLESSVDLLTRNVADAERRLGGPQEARHEPLPFQASEGSARAPDVFAALAAAMAQNDGKAKAPERIILGLDHLDATTPERARAILDVVHRAAIPGLVTLFGADAARLDPDGAGRADLERWCQVPFRLDVAPSAEASQALLREALGHGETGFAPTKLDARRSDLDAPIAEEEVLLLTALSDLAGRTPRALKRFANLYRLARLGDARPLGPLAFMLAVMLGGTDAERNEAAAARRGDGAARYDLPNGASGRLPGALNAAVAIGGRFTRSEAADAMRRAATFSLAPHD